MILIDALKELLDREWGETAETQFILEAVAGYERIKQETEKEVELATVNRLRSPEIDKLNFDDIPLVYGEKP